MVPATSSLRGQAEGKERVARGVPDEWRWSGGVEVEVEVEGEVKVEVNVEVEVEMGMEMEVGCVMNSALRGS